MPQQAMPQSPVNDSLMGVLRRFGLAAPPPVPNPQPLPQEPPNRPMGQNLLDDALDVIMGAIGINDPLSPRASKASTMGGLVSAAAPLMAIKGIRAFHGSPHDFDKFSLEKIGTGEGAQAYGHGLYFAENEGTAKGYRDMWPSAERGPRVKIDGQNLYDLAAKTQSPIEMRAYKRLIEDGDIDAAIRNADVNASYPDPEVQRLLSQWKQTRRIDTPSGRMYEVNIKADPEQFLDWDSAVDAQPGTVRDTLKTRFASGTVARDPAGPRPDITLRGGEVYQKLVREEAIRLNEQQGLSPSEARARAAENISAALNQAGVRGMRYFDQGSRTQGEGTHNYVVFDDAIVEILRKFGLLAPLAAAAGASSLKGQMGQDRIQQRNLRHP